MTSPYLQTEIRTQAQAAAAYRHAASALRREALAIQEEQRALEEDAMREMDDDRYIYQVLGD